MAASINDYFQKLGGASSLVNTPKVTATRAAAGATLTVDNCNWDTTTGKRFATFQVNTSGAVVAGTEIIWKGIVTSTTSIGSLARVAGASDSGNAIGDYVMLLPASDWANQLVAGMLVQHNQDGTHGAVTATSVTASGTITAANFIQSGGAGAAGWTVGLANPNTVTALGNRSYSLVFSGTDLTSTLSPGMRLRTQRTVAAPTQCTSLNGTTQFYSKTSPAGMTFTNNFVVSAWVKMSSYANATIASRYNGTSGWTLRITSSGQVQCVGFNAGAANSNHVDSYQSIPLNKWVHVTAKLDMSSATVTGGTNNYIMIDGVDVPCFKGTGGTNPTALIQAGNLEIGSENAGTQPFPGKIAQVAIYSAHVSEATILASMHQTLAGTETSLISAYSFNNSINDLNANANNLTANGSAVATNADSPFGGQADGTISSTLDYAIVTKTAFSTNTTLTVQVPEGCTIPTSGGVSAVSYATVKAPYGMPVQRGKWGLLYLNRQQASNTAPTLNIWYSLNGANAQGNAFITAPICEWIASYQVSAQVNATSGAIGVEATLSTANNTESDITFTGHSEQTASSDFGTQIYKSGPLSVAAAAPYYLNTRTVGAAAGPTVFNRGDVAITIISLENAYL